LKTFKEIVQYHQM